MLKRRGKIHETFNQAKIIYNVLENMRALFCGDAKKKTNPKELQAMLISKSMQGISYSPSSVYLPAPPGDTLRWIDVLSRGPSSNTTGHFVFGGFGSE